jgi:hypothetical protein
VVSPTALSFIAPSTRGHLFLPAHASLFSSLFYVEFIRISNRYIDRWLALLLARRSCQLFALSVLLAVLSVSKRAVRLSDLCA